MKPPYDLSASHPIIEKGFPKIEDHGHGMVYRSTFGHLENLIFEKVAHTKLDCCRVFEIRNNGRSWLRANVSLPLHA